MSRIWTDGFEINSNTAGINGWSVVNGLVSGCGVTTTQPRSGEYCGQVAPANGAPFTGWHKQIAASAVSGPFWKRIYIHLHTAPTGEVAIAYFHSALITVGTTTAVLCLTIDNNRQLRLYENGTLVGSASSAIDLDKAYRIEIKGDWSPASGSRVVEGKINGTTFTSTAVSTFAGTVAWFGVGLSICNNKVAGGSIVMYFDDIAINDGIGSVDNSYPGSGRVVNIWPSSAGDNALWTPSTGANYECVDENPPNDQTDYVSRPTGAAGTYIDDHNLPAMSTRRLYAGDTIKLITIHARGGSDSTQVNATRSIFPRFKTKAGGTVSEPGSSINYSINISVNGYVTDGVPQPRTGYTIYTDPDTNEAIKVTDAESSSGVNSLESAQIGIRCEGTTNVGTLVRFTNIYAVVEFETAPKDLSAKADVVFDMKGILPGAGLTAKTHVAFGFKGDLHSKGLLYPSSTESLVFGMKGDPVFSAPVVVHDTGFMPFFFS